MQRHTGSSSGSSSALCLALEKGGPPQNWAPLVLAPCTSSDRKQQWRYTAGARPVLQYAGYKNANGNAMCIQIDGENPWLGSPAGLWPCSAAGEWCVASMCASCNCIQSIFFLGDKNDEAHHGGLILRFCFPRPMDMRIVCVCARLCVRAAFR